MINKVNRHPQFVRKGKCDFYVYVVYLIRTRNFMIWEKCNGVDHQLPFYTCIGTLRILVNTKCSFKMPFMMILLRYRVSISDGKTKIINVHHAECDKSVQKYQLNIRGFIM